MVKSRSEKTGVVVGFLGAFFISAAMFYFILNFLEKLPASWGYFHIVSIGTLIVFGGVLIKLWFD